MRGIRIVLVETLGALNLGAVARVMQNMGLKDLVLVNPQCRLDDPEAEKMAVHAQDILVGARVVPDLLSALQDCDRILATVGRRERGDRPVFSLEEGCRWLAERGSQPAIVFGREDRGLSNWELRYFPAVLTIDTDPQAPSLNLAQAVAIFCYQWRSQQRSHPTPTPSGTAGDYRGVGGGVCGFAGVVVADWLSLSSHCLCPHAETAPYLPALSTEC